MSDNTHPVPKWAELLLEGDFISYLPSYSGRIYSDLFDEFTFPCEETGDITYYVYDPVKHGGSTKREYPVLLFLHGATNALDGKACIGYCGGEMFASPQYQWEMDGAYIVVPLANEKLDGDGKLIETFSEKYFEPLKRITERVRENGSTGKVFAVGGSLGGWMTWKMAEKYPKLFDAIIPVSTGYIPTDERLDNIARHKISVFVTLGQHDETFDYAEKIAPRIKKMEELGFLMYFPEWVRNGDGGAASLFCGWEMGQHCMINQVQGNLLYDSRQPYFDKLPHGVTGWIRDIVFNEQS